MTELVYHGTFEENVESIFEKGIIPYYGVTEKTLNLRVGIRRGSVYAYLREQLEKYLTRAWGKPGDVWIEVEVDPDKVFVAEMRFEAYEMNKKSPYWKSFMKLSEYIRTHERYMEPEVLIPHKVSPEQLTGVVLDWKLRPISIGRKPR